MKECLARLFEIQNLGNFEVFPRNGSWLDKRIHGLDNPWYISTLNCEPNERPVESMVKFVVETDGAPIDKRGYHNLVGN